MPLFSRMGPYDTEMLKRASESKPRRMVEYWAHVQAFMPVELWPAMQHRMDHYRAQRGKWVELGTDESMQWILDAVRDRGASTARDLDSGAPREAKHWGWNWSEARKGLDWFFMIGELAVAGRNSQFEVVYDLPERVLPDSVLAMPTPTPAEAHKELVRRAAVSHGVATARCLADYYRLRQVPAPGRPSAPGAIDELVEDGELVPVQVEGWSTSAYLHRDARRPRQVGARALLSPFDPVVWERQRTERLFDFHYRIEIYTPAAKRRFGYYVLPFLLGNRIVARVDLKADRPGRALQVKGAYAEATAPGETAEQLAAELIRLAAWLGLDSILVGPRGDLAPALAGLV
jgi:uncharacterized protein YcaQ